jgi:hypothetical protein
MNLKELTKYSVNRHLEFIDLKFTDIPGLWQYITGVTLFQSEINDA